MLYALFSEIMYAFISGNMVAKSLEFSVNQLDTILISLNIIQDLHYSVFSFSVVFKKLVLFIYWEC